MKKPIVLISGYYLGVFLAFHLAVNGELLLRRRRLPTAEEELTILAASIQAPLYPRTAWHEFRPAIIDNDSNNP